MRIDIDNHGNTWKNDSHDNNNVRVYVYVNSIQLSFVKSFFQSL